MEFVSAAVSSISLVQLQVFAVAALLSAALFSMGFLLGRVSNRNRSVKVPMEVIHALTSGRFDARHVVANAASDKGHEDDVLHAIEAILDHVHHEKDFKKAHDYAVHEIEKLEAAHGHTHDLDELLDKVSHAHNKAELEAALKDFIDHHKH
ncbi:MAG: hypothetical protein KBA31_21980 [Alphaproteobacteria bacterium]|nr:hypothetical protein [Alphaproteobacteria bacterium]